MTPAPARMILPNLPRKGQPRRMLSRAANLFIGLGALALMLVAIAAYDPVEGLRYWALSAAATADRVLPLVGLGILLAQLAPRLRGVAVALLLVGGFAGIAGRYGIYVLLAPIPGAAGNYFLAGPITSVLAGLLLVLPPPWRAAPACLLLPPIGAMTAIGLLLGDAALHADGYGPLAVVASLWLLLVVGLLQQLLPVAVAQTGSRVLGSWLVAIGLLYGGAYIASKQPRIVPPPFPSAPADGDLPGFDGWTFGVAPAVGGSRP